MDCNSFVEETDDEVSVSHNSLSSNIIGKINDSDDSCIENSQVESPASSKVFSMFRKRFMNDSNTTGRIVSSSCSATSSESGSIGDTLKESKGPNGGESSTVKHKTVIATHTNRNSLDGSSNFLRTSELMGKLRKLTLISPIQVYFYSLSKRFFPVLR